jgi:riboflavin synthase alpha subunit
VFTGIISAKVRVAAFTRRPQGALLALERPEGWDDVKEGESVAVSGVCLTALLGRAGEQFRFDLSRNALASDARRLRKPVNLKGPRGVRPLRRPFVPDT